MVIPLRIRLVSLLLLLAAVIAAGCLVWWSGRPERHLAEAGLRLLRGEFGAVPGWLALPEATARTRDRALLIRARVALGRGRPAEAVPALDAIDAGGPVAADAAFWKGRTLMAVGQSRRAAEWFRSVAERRPDDVDARRWLASALYEMGDRRGALAGLREVVRLSPDDPRAWRTIALLLKEDVDLETARDAYRTTLRLDPAQPLARLELAEVLTELGEYDEAEGQLQACSGGAPEADRLALVAKGVWARGDRERIGPLLGRALAEHPSHVGLLSLASQVEMAEGRTDRAIALLDRALIVDPHHAESYYRRGLLRKAAGNLDGAALDLGRSSELKAALAEMSRLDDEAAARPDDPEVRVRVAQLCERLGKFELAMSWYRAALAVDPRHGPAREGLAALAPQ